MNPEETTQADAALIEANTGNGSGNGSVQATTKEARAEQKDSFPIQGIDYIEFYVGNAKQAAQFYRSVMGFNVTAYAGPETKVRDRASYVLEQNKIRMVMTAPMYPEAEIADHLRLHGDGVRDIALVLPDVDDAYHTAAA